MGEAAHCRNRFASLEQRRLLERGIVLLRGRLHGARGQRHVAAIRQPMPAVREIGPRRTQPPHSLLRAQHQRHAVMNRRNDRVRAGGHHRKASFVPHACKQQRYLVFGAETISTLDVPARFRTANCLRCMRFEEAARGHHAAPARYRPRPHARVRPHRFLQARVIHRALRPLSSKSPGQTQSGKHTARIGNNHVNRRPRSSIRWHRASSPNQASRPIGHHVNRRDRLKHANNVRNLVPTQNLKPPTHRKPLALLVRGKSLAHHFEPISRQFNCCNTRARKLRQHLSSIRVAKPLPTINLIPPPIRFQNIRVTIPAIPTWRPIVINQMRFKQPDCSFDVNQEPVSIAHSIVVRGKALFIRR